ncbi:MAG: hypothetical protein QG622_613 [Actinomycetota bacterium]|nr:hypothetical protein [Actinomycetota bacterium]
MGLVQDAQASVTRYGDSASTTALAAAGLARQVDVLNEQLSAEGPLGLSTDPSLAAARTLLGAARHHLAEAAEAALASQEQVRQYADRAFPL